MQQRTDEGTSRVHLRVTSHEESDVPVRGIGLDWPNYPTTGTSRYETVLGPGLTLDLPFTLPTPVCAAPEETPVGLVRTARGVLRAPLDEVGRDYLERIWSRECIKKSVTDRMSLGFDDEWRTVPHEDTLALVGALSLERVQGTDTVDVLGFEGSVLLDVDPDGDLVSLSPSDARIQQGVLVTSSGRCDPHSRAESKQTFLFRVEVKVGNDSPVRVIVLPDRRMQLKAWNLGSAQSLVDT